MGSHIIDVNKVEGAPTKVKSPSKETIDAQIAENASKLKSQMIR